MPGRCSTSVARRGVARRWPSSRRSIPTGSGCGRCWRWRSTSAPARPTPSRPCGGCASGWPTSSASTRRRRSSGSSRPCCGRTRRWQRRPRPSADRSDAATGGPAAAVAPRARPARSGREQVLAQALAVVERGDRDGTRCGSCWSPASPASASRGWSLTSARRHRAGHAGAGRPVPRGRLRAGAVALAGVVRALAGHDPDPLLVPLLDEDVTSRRPGQRHRACGCSTRSSRLLEQGRRPVPCCWSSRTSTGPTRPRCSCCATWRRRGCARRSRWSAPVVRPRPRRSDGPGRHAGRARPGRGRAAAARRARQRLGRRAAGRRRSATHDPRLDAFVGDVTGGNPFFVLQYARELAGDTRPRPPRPRRRCRSPTASATCCGSGSSGCPDDAVGAAHVGGRARRRHRPRPGRRA